MREMIFCCCHTFFSPGHSFLGCFHLGFGVKLLMWSHLVLNCYYTAYSVSRIIADDGSFFDSSQILDTLTALIGIPISVLGLFGVYNRLEPHVRVYLFYLALCVSIDLFYIVDMFLLRDSCSHVKLLNHMRGGRAFACGVAQSISNVSAVLLVLAAFYMIYVVWSWCEEVDCNNVDWALQSLLAMSEGKPPVKHRSHQLALDPDFVSNGVEAGMDSVHSVVKGAHLVYGAVSNEIKKQRLMANQLVNESLDDMEHFAVGRAGLR